MVEDEYFHTSSANKNGSKILKKLIRFGSGVAHTFFSKDYFKFYFVLWVRWKPSDCHRNVKSHRCGENRLCLGSDLPLARKEDVIIFGDLCPLYNKEYLKKYLVLKQDTDKIFQIVENFMQEHDLN